MIGSATSLRIGMGVSATNRCAIMGEASDGANPSSSGKAYRNDAIFVAGIAAAFLGALDLVGPITDNMRFIVDDTFTSSVRFQILVIDGLTGADIFQVLSPATGGTPKDGTHTLPFADPELLIFMGGGPTNAIPPTVSTSFQLYLGGACADGQFVMSLLSRNGVSPMNTKHYGYHGSCLAHLGVAGTVVEEASFPAAGGISGTTLTLNWKSIQGTANIHYCAALKGIDATIFNGLTKTDGTDIAMTGLAGSCLGGLIVSTCEAEDAAATAANNNHFSVGSFVSSAHRGCHAGWDENGSSLAISETALGVYYDEVYLNISSADAMQGLADVKAASNNATLVMDDTDPAQNWFAGVLIADPGSGPSVTDDPITPGTTVAI